MVNHFFWATGRRAVSSLNKNRTFFCRIARKVSQNGLLGWNMKVFPFGISEDNFLAGGNSNMTSIFFKWVVQPPTRKLLRDV